MDGGAVDGARRRMGIWRKRLSGVCFLLSDRCPQDIYREKAGRGPPGVSEWALADGGGGGWSYRCGSRQ